MPDSQRDLAWRLFLCATIGLLAATIFLAATFVPESEGLSFSPCQDSEFTETFDARSYETIRDDRLWPPGTVCRAYTPDGRFLREETYPKAGDWLIALAVFLSPFAFVAIYRRAPSLRRAAG
jgi:hypothetical protein